jgi:ATP-dependent DNA helicase RecG
MSRLRLKPPTIEETEAVLVTLRHEALASAEAMILKYLETHEEITNQEARSITGVMVADTIKGHLFGGYAIGIARGGS